MMGVMHMCVDPQKIIIRVMNTVFLIIMVVMTSMMMIEGR